MNKLFVKSLITHLTKPSRRHLTPEIELSLITPECRLWSAVPESSPFEDPFWAFYWPGGQALSRYIMDNPSIVHKKSILDVGSGCGAAAIVSSLAGASRVVANDIDPVASIAIEMNMKRNSAYCDINTDNLLLSNWPGHFDIIFMGDMFYDAEFALIISSWMKNLTMKTNIFIGDPGRMAFENHPLKSSLQQMAEYELPASSQQENNGLTHSHVWLFQP